MHTLALLKGMNDAKLPLFCLDEETQFLLWGLLVGKGIKLNSARRELVKNVSFTHSA